MLKSLTKFKEITKNLSGEKLNMGVHDFNTQGGSSKINQEFAKNSSFFPKLNNFFSKNSRNFVQNSIFRKLKDPLLPEKQPKNNPGIIVKIPDQT